MSCAKKKKRFLMCFSMPGRGKHSFHDNQRLSELLKLKQPAKKLDVPFSICATVYFIDQR